MSLPMLFNTPPMHAAIRRLPLATPLLRDFYAAFDFAISTPPPPRRHL